MQRRSYLSIPILMALGLPVVPLIRAEKALFDPPLQCPPDPASLQHSNLPARGDDGNGGGTSSPPVSKWTLTRINLPFMRG